LAEDYTARLALLEELKGLPANAVWDFYCLQEDVPLGFAFIKEIRTYEQHVLATRG
jgi:L-rhamnose isomerase